MKNVLILLSIAFVFNSCITSSTTKVADNPQYFSKIDHVYTNVRYSGTRISQFYSRFKFCPEFSFRANFGKDHFLVLITYPFGINQMEIHDKLKVSVGTNNYLLKSNYMNTECIQNGSEDMLAFKVTNFRFKMDKNILADLSYTNEVYFTLYTGIDSTIIKPHSHQQQELKKLIRK